MAELFTERCSYSRSGLANDDLIRIIDCLNDFVDALLLCQSTDRTCCHALSALHAVDCVESCVIDRADLGLETAVHKAENTDALDLLTGLYAALAEHALGCIADDTRTCVLKCRLCILALEPVLADAKLLAELLQLAVQIALAGQAVLVVVGHDQLNRGFACADRALGVGPYDHSLGDRRCTCGKQSSCALDFHETYTACAALYDILKIAERWDTDIGSSGSIQDCLTGLSYNLLIIYNNIHFTHLTSSC